MADPEKPSPPRAAADGSAPAAPRSLAASLVDEGNALLKQGHLAPALARYDAAVRADPSCAPAHLNRGNALQTVARFDEARHAYHRAIACDPRYVAAHFNLGNLNYHAGEFAQALQNYQAAIGLAPQFADAFIGMANALLGLGRTAEAADGYRHALTIEPRHAEAHFNLGVLAASAERHHEAAASLGRAIELRPDRAPSHRMLGAVLHRLGDIEGAEASLRRASSLEPDSAGILCELAAILQHRGRYGEAAQLLARALPRAPNWATKVAFAHCAANTRLTVTDPLVHAALTSALTEAWAMPHHLCRSAISVIMLDERVAGCVRRANESWPLRPPRAVLFGTDGLAALAADSLLHALLDAAPVMSIEFERFLSCARHVLLEIALSPQAPEPGAGGLRFYAALVRQCWINEYVYDCPDTEQLAAARCREKLLALLDAGAAVPPLLLLAVAGYFPLHELRDAGRLLAAGEPTPLLEVRRQQIVEPLEEQALRAGIRSLTPIAAASEAVRGQYERSPYPRWVRLERRVDPLPFNVELRRLLPFAPFSPLPDDGAPEVLVAGCGTGGDAVALAQRFRGVRVLAVDLSLSSLSYAKRKTQELGLANIDYARADILELGAMGRTFDVIQSAGVLHHLADPFEGWRILLSRLRPGGLMSLGLYSRIARSAVLRAREFIRERGYAATAEDIRRFRQDASAPGASDELKLLTRSRSFYSLSDCRDLAFHVQEHQLTLEQIESFLTENGLRFIGFELDPGTLHHYRARFSDDPSCTNLRNWTRYEAEHPDTFSAMYQFWIQR